LYLFIIHVYAGIGDASKHLVFVQPAFYLKFTFISRIAQSVVNDINNYLLLKKLLQEQVIENF
jgi:hypothetical protein